MDNNKLAFKKSEHCCSMIWKLKLFHQSDIFQAWREKKTVKCIESESFSVGAVCSSRSVPQSFCSSNTQTHSGVLLILVAIKICQNSYKYHPFHYFQTKPSCEARAPETAKTENIKSFEQVSDKHKRRSAVAR